MATKIRLARHGRKGQPVYYIVAADSRSPRDGRFIEKLGIYNPNTNPATVNINFERALYWVTVGAQPTETAKNILSHEGVLMKKHLLEGVRKGAFDEATCEAKFAAWTSARDAKTAAKVEKLAQAGDSAAKARFEAESKVRAEKEAALTKKREEAAAAAAAAAATEETAETTEAAPEENAAE